MTNRRKSAATAAPVDQAPRIPTAEDIAHAHQRAEVTLRVDGLTWPDGSPMELRIRALSFRQRAEVGRAAAKAAVAPAVIDEDTWAIETALRGIVQPQLTRAQIDVLLDSNANIIDDIVDAIIQIGRVDARSVERRLESLAGVTVPPAPNQA